MLVLSLKLELIKGSQEPKNRHSRARPLTWCRNFLTANRLGWRRSSDGKQKPIRVLSRAFREKRWKPSSLLLLPPPPPSSSSSLLLPPPSSSSHILHPNHDCVLQRATDGSRCPFLFLPGSGSAHEGKLGSMDEGLRQCHCLRGGAEEEEGRAGSSVGH